MNWQAAGVIVAVLAVFGPAIWWVFKFQARDAAEEDRGKAQNQAAAVRKQFDEDEARILRLIDASLLKFEQRRKSEDLPAFQLSARDWVNIMAAIEKQFNGRYWLAPEARAAIAVLQQALGDLRNHLQGQDADLQKAIGEMTKHSQEQNEKLHERISNLRKELTA